MYTEITLKNFKSFREATIPLSPFTILIGANASGKSNFLDAIHFLQGVGNKLSFDEIINGRPEDGTVRQWEGIRGGQREVLWHGRGETDGSPTSFTIRANLRFDVSGPINTEYTIEVDPSKRIVLLEKLTSDLADHFSGETVNSTPDEFRFRVTFSSHKKGTDELNTPNDKPALPMVDMLLWSETYDVLGITPENGSVQPIDPIPSMCIDFFSHVMNYDWSLGILREYSRPGLRTIGRRGENFASVVASIIEGKFGTAFTDWLSEITPLSIDEIDFFKTEDGDLMFGVKEKGYSNKLSARVISDGTLRFAALAAALFAPNSPDVMLLEEIENGIHPTRLGLVLNMVRQVSQLRGIQVIVTTHSPYVLAYLEKGQLSQVVYFGRSEDDDSSKALRITELPDFEEVYDRRGADWMLESGWLEASIR